MDPKFFVWLLKLLIWGAHGKLATAKFCQIQNFHYMYYNDKTALYTTIMKFTDNNNLPFVYIDYPLLIIDW